MGKNSSSQGTKPTTKQKGSFEQIFEFRRYGDRSGQTTVVKVKESEANGINAAWIELATNEHVGLHEVKRLFERLPNKVATAV